MSKNNTKDYEYVNHPPHYNWLKDKCGVEVIDIARHLDFNLGNAIKYILRAGKKPIINNNTIDFNKSAIQDLNKAIWYINDKIKMLENEINKTKCRNNKTRKI